MISSVVHCRRTTCSRHDRYDRTASVLLRLLITVSELVTGPKKTKKTTFDLEEKFPS